MGGPGVTSSSLANPPCSVEDVPGDCANNTDPAAVPRRLIGPASNVCSPLLDRLRPRDVENPEMFNKGDRCCCAAALVPKDVPGVRPEDTLPPAPADDPA